MRIAHSLSGVDNPLGPNIRILCLERNKIGDLGAEGIAKFLQENSSLLFLDLSLNQIGDRGLVAISQAIQKNFQLQTLLISGNEFSFRAIPTL